MDKPANPGSIPLPLALRSITANNVAKKIIKLPTNSNRIANHLNKGTITEKIKLGPLHTYMGINTVCTEKIKASKKLSGNFDILKEVMAHGKGQVTTTLKSC